LSHESIMCFVKLHRFVSYLHIIYTTRLYKDEHHLFSALFFVLVIDELLKVIARTTELAQTAS